MSRSLLYLTILLLTSGPIQAENRVWTTCTEDSDCGTNEICQKVTDVDPPCSKGLCACRPCYGVYSWSDYCTKPTYKGLYDECVKEESGVLYPANAGCSDDGIVNCNEGFRDSFSVNFEDSCQSIGITGQAEDEKPCEQNSDCFSDLVCNNEFKCSCYFSYEKWDRVTKRCVKREFGDPCKTAEDCQVSGKDWEGFTYSSGACFNGYCGCSEDGQSAIVSYFQPGTNTLKVKTICVVARANFNISKGSPCTLDPVYSGDSPRAAICSTATVCYQCPEQYEKRQLPICRAVTPSKMEDPKCYPKRSRKRKPEKAVSPLTVVMVNSTSSYKVVTLAGDNGDANVVPAPRPATPPSNDRPGSVNKAATLILTPTCYYATLSVLSVQLIFGIISTS